MIAAQGTTTTGRPWHLWLVGIIGVVWSSMGVLSFMLTLMNVEAVMSRFPPQQRAYFESFPWWAVAFWAIGVFGGVIGCVLLLLENRLAFRALLASLIGTLVYNLGGLFLLGGMAVMRETGGLGFTAIPIVFAAFLAYYARAMSRKGVVHAVLAALFLMLPSPAREMKAAAHSSAPADDAPSVGSWSFTTCVHVRKARGRPRIWNSGAGHTTLTKQRCTSRRSL